jgi:hypothetical protein
VGGFFRSCEVLVALCATLAGLTKVEFPCQFNPTVTYCLSIIVITNVVVFMEIWEQLLAEAQAQNDSANLIVKITELEAALSSRLQQLRVSDDGQKETEAIWQACQEIRKLKTDRLKWSRSNNGTKRPKRALSV